MSNLPIRDDTAGDAEAILTAVRDHVWKPPARDPQSHGHLWTCSCTYSVFQPSGAPVPDELVSHPQSFGQMRGEAS